MILRTGIDRADVKDIDRIWREHHSESFGIPSLKSCIMKGTVRSEEKLVAFGMVNLFAELILVMDPGMSLRKRIEAMNILLKRSMEVELDQVHCFVDNPDLADILKKHFGFKEIKGTGLVLNLERG